MVAPRIGQGTILGIRISTGPDIYTDIARLTEIGEFGGDTDDIEITNHDSAAAVREYIRGLSEPGEISMVGIWIADPSQLMLFTKTFAGIVPNDHFKITLPAGMGVAEFDGFVAAFRMNPQLDGRMEFSSRIKLSGAWTFV